MHWHLFTGRHTLVHSHTAAKTQSISEQICEITVIVVNKWSVFLIIEYIMGDWSIWFPFPSLHLSAVAAAWWKI